MEIKLGKEGKRGGWLSHVPAMDGRPRLDRYSDEHKDDDVILDCSVGVYRERVVRGLTDGKESSRGTRAR
jgi:hypothetical protein